jgi:hypothetical protein
LRMGADTYFDQPHVVRWFYAGLPALVMILSIVLNILSQCM